jgi:adenylyltransferase/sulfurtransferase
MYLAAAGAGHLSLVDHDRVDLSNLQRQIAHTTASVGQFKVESAQAALLALNPTIRVDVYPERLEGQALAALVSQHDVVLDCTDNFATRFALNAACVQHKVPLVSGAAIRLEAQVSVFDTRRPDSPCYRCLYSEDDEADMSCSHNGVIAPLVGIIGSLQALEAMKLIGSLGVPLVGKLLLLDATHMQWRELKLKKDPDCPVCGVVSPALVQ